jgi:hypothetical protein
MVTTLGMLALLVATGTPSESFERTLYRPRIELWTNHGDAVYSRGQNVRVYFRIDRDAFITILRVDTDGRVRVLFPRDPWEDNYARGGRDYEIEGRAGRDAFHIDDYPGVGYIFGVAAADPFTYGQFVSGDHWDYRLIAEGRVRGDPYVALTDLAARIVPPDYADWDYDLLPYHVERRHDYPRFLCYDCHSYASYVYWNPYRYSCATFRIVIYDDPWYYPYRYYRGTRVVFVRPYRPEPRFIFKNRSTTDAFVTRARQRPANERGVRGRDIGGIVAPRLRDPANGSAQPDRPVRSDRPDQPARTDRPDRTDRPGRSDGSDRPGRSSQPDSPERPNRPESRDRPNPADRPDHPNTPDRPQRLRPADRPARTIQAERPGSGRETGGTAGRGTETRESSRGAANREVRAERPPSRAPAPSEPQRAARSRPPEPRAAPRNERPSQPRAAPRNERPRSEPKQAPDRQKPELKRRKS